VRLSLSVDDSEVATVSSERFNRVFAGNALIGRAAIDDRSGPRQCECSIKDLTISRR
jgi:arylsulfatase